jgi:hypothetical protein
MKKLSPFEIDPYLLGSTLGFLLVIPYLSLDYLLSLIFKSNPIPLYSSMLIMTHTAILLDFALGITGDLIAGAFMGFIITIILERTNYHYLWVKGLGIGAVLWIVHVCVLPKLWEPQLLTLMTRPTIFIAFVTHVLWGLAYGMILGYVRKQLKNPKGTTS